MWWNIVWYWAVSTPCPAVIKNTSLLILYSLQSLSTTSNMFTQSSPCSHSSKKPLISPSIGNSSKSGASQLQWNTSVALSLLACNIACLMCTSLSLKLIKLYSTWVTSNSVSVISCVLQSKKGIKVNHWQWLMNIF